jgi:hypothetical protein
MAVREQLTFQRGMGRRLLGNELHRSAYGYGNQHDQFSQGDVPHFRVYSTVIQTEAGNKVDLVLR